MFNKAISRGDAGEAWNWAKRMPPTLSLDRALQLTVALGVVYDPRYKRAADRFLERYESEEGVPGIEAAKVRDLLRLLGREGPLPLKFGAGADLREIAARLADHR